ncbi:MAG: DUF3429 family protein [Gammaproteobacteria bacterium]|nr:DUF3429 family protein [Gammaproteobacteria bacterium]
MGSADNGAGTIRWRAAAEWIGYLSVAPLVLCLAGVGLLPQYAGRDLAQRGAIAWGAALLAITGGVHLGLVVGARLPWERARLAAVLAPALTAAAAVLVSGQRGLAVLVAGCGSFWLYEHRSLGAQLPETYLNLRRQLTLATCMLLALTMFASDAAGLG